MCKLLELSAIFYRVLWASPAVTAYRDYTNYRKLLNMEDPRLPHYVSTLCIQIHIISKLAASAANFHQA